jgi:hypothetical protein
MRQRPGADVYRQTRSADDEPRPSADAGTGTTSAMRAMSSGTDTAEPTPEDATVHSAFVTVPGVIRQVLDLERRWEATWEFTERADVRADRDLAAAVSRKLRYLERARAWVERTPAGPLCPDCHPENPEMEGENEYRCLQHAEAQLQDEVRLQEVEQKW